jgi:hypothetical protein
VPKCMTIKASGLSRTKRLRGLMRKLSYISR